MGSGHFRPGMSTTKWSHRQTDDSGGSGEHGPRGGIFAVTGGGDEQLIQVLAAERAGGDFRNRKLDDVGACRVQL